LFHCRLFRWMKHRLLATHDKTPLEDEDKQYSYILSLVRIISARVASLKKKRLPL
jgi:hypothetical protein